MILWQDNQGGAYQGLSLAGKEEDASASPSTAEVTQSVITGSDILLSPPLSVHLRTPTVCAGQAVHEQLQEISAPPPTPDYQEPPVWKDVHCACPSRRVLFQSGFGSSPRLATLFSKRRNNKSDTCNISRDFSPKKLRAVASESWPKRAGEEDGQWEGDNIEEVRVTASPMLLSELIVDESEWAKDEKKEEREGVRGEHML